MAEQINESDRDAWSTTNSLRLSAAFRHCAQASLRGREWVPKAPYVLDIITFLEGLVQDFSIFCRPLQAHKPLKRLPSDIPSGRRKIKGKQPPDRAAKVAATATVSKPAEAEEQETGDAGQSGDSTASSSSSSESSSSSSSNNSQAVNQQAQKPQVATDHESKPQEQHPQQQSSSPQADAQEQSKPQDQNPLKPSRSSSSSISRNHQGLSDFCMI